MIHTPILSKEQGREAVTLRPLMASRALSRVEGALGCQAPGSRGVGQTEAVPERRVRAGQTTQGKASRAEVRRERVGLGAFETTVC